MRFNNKEQEIRRTVEGVGIILSLGAIFFQIWVLSSSIERFLAGSKHGMQGSVIFSFIALAVCALTAWTTGLDFLKGSKEGRTKTYNNPKI